MLNHDDQQKRLQELLAFATSPTPGHCNFGMMIFLARAGDVAFLTPIVPELRGVEIVSALARSDGREYDIWKRGRMIESNLTKSAVMEWLQRHSHHHTEKDFYAHGAAWAEQTLRYYKVPKKENRA